MSENGIFRRRAESMNDVWCWDFIHDRDEQGRPLKWLSIVDEYTRECLALEVERSMKAVDVVDLVSQVMLIRGRPRHIRSDNGKLCKPGIPGGGKRGVRLEPSRSTSFTETRQ